MDYLVLGLSLAVWATTALGTALIGFWLLEVLLLRAPVDETVAYGASDVQARILTVDAASVVQRTVDALPASLGTPQVIAERAIPIDGADLFVVPEAFACRASAKGRALEWARQSLPTSKEFVLYLDEDSVLTEFPGVPDRDIVQLREQPQYAGSVVAYIADVFRMGLQIEQVSFPRLRIPLYAWGGGIIIRATVEQKVSWDRDSLVEDTAFAWAAALQMDGTFGISRILTENQAPPSVRALLRQRRRWAGGNHRELTKLPQPYRFLTKLRNYSWGLAPLVAALNPLVLVTAPDLLLGAERLWLPGWALAGVIPAWFVLGYLQYTERKPSQLLGLPVLPLSVLLHGAGALWGIVSPPRTFQVTPKRPPE